MSKALNGINAIKEAERQTPLEILNSEKITLTVVEVAKVLNVSKGTIYKNIRETGFAADGLPAIQVCNSYRVSTFLLRKWLGL
jgi:excisionase family DNA binding protein